MKFHALLLLAFLGVVTALTGDDGALESVKKAKWVHSDYTNDKYGISVSVRLRPENERKGTSWGQGTFKEIDVDGTKVSISTQEDDEEIAEIRVPLNAGTIEYLFTAEAEPDYVRFIAASHITDSNLSEKEQLSLLKRGISLSDATLRYYIWHDIRGFKPRQKVAELLHLGLRDPCITIAHECLGAIIDEYDLQSADGEEIEWTTFWRGPMLVHYIVQHREILEVAEALRKKRPDLMPVQELKKIRNRAMPSDEWFELHFADRDAKAREYFREYAAKTTAEQDGADQPATAPESKPVGDLKPKPKAEVRPQ